MRITESAASTRKFLCCQGSVCQLFQKRGIHLTLIPLRFCTPCFLAAWGNLWNFSIKKGSRLFLSTSPTPPKSKLNSDNTAHCNGLPFTQDTVILLLFYLPFVLLFYGSLCYKLLCCFFQIMLLGDFCISMTEHCLQPCQIVLWSYWISQTKVRPGQNLVEIMYTMRLPASHWEQAWQKPDLDAESVSSGQQCCHADRGGCDIKKFWPVLAGRISQLFFFLREVLMLIPVFWPIPNPLIFYQIKLQFNRILYSLIFFFLCCCVMMFALKTCYCCPESCISVLGEILLKFSLLFWSSETKYSIEGLQMKGPGKVEITSESDIQEIIVELFLGLLEVSDQKAVRRWVTSTHLHTCWTVLMKLREEQYNRLEISWYAQMSIDRLWSIRKAE